MLVEMDERPSGVPPVVVFHVCRVEGSIEATHEA